MYFPVPDELLVFEPHRTAYALFGRNWFPVISSNLAYGVLVGDHAVSIKSDSSTR
jgi:hypothetical protein